MRPQIRYKTFDQLSFADVLVYSQLPKHPFWSYVESRIDFSFADRLCSVLYTGLGPRPYAPSLKLKVHLVQTYYALSDRLTEEKIVGDLFIKRFLGLPVDFFGFDHSTLGLDRQRMGTAMFQACHLVVLAHLYSLGLWGDREERWIIDSFPSHAGVVVLPSYRLIQQALLQVVRHLKRSHAPLYQLTSQTLDFGPLLHRLSSSTTTQERLLAFSKLAALGHALLHFLETEEAIRLFSGARLTVARQRSLSLQNILARVLQENSRTTDANKKDEPPPSTGTPGGEAPADLPGAPALESSSAPTEAEEERDEPEQELAYEKIPRSERPSNRVISPFHPDARVGMKTVTQGIKGFKTQNMCTENGVILNTKVIPATEHDREAMAGMVKEIQQFFGLTPRAILGDTAYGHGKQRQQLLEQGVTVIAPVPRTQNPTGLYDLSQFRYDPQQDVFHCPGEQESCRKTHNKGTSGTQYYFRKSACAACPLRTECTTNAGGRSVFRSDYVELYEQAARYNESLAGKEAMSKRPRGERKNQEMKNNCGLGALQATSQKTVSKKAIWAGIVVNLKHMVRVLVDPPLGFLRRAPLAR